MRNINVFSNQFSDMHPFHQLKGIENLFPVVFLSKKIRVVGRVIYGVEHRAHLDIFLCYRNQIILNGGLNLSSRPFSPRSKKY